MPGSAKLKKSSQNSSAHGKRQSTTTTNASSPDDSFDYETFVGKGIFDAEIQKAGGSPLEFDVKPRTKKYNSPEEYKKKYKTELCKNFQLKGCCKFGDKCSFAHGDHELREKVHLHTNYKTKPCKQFHTSGHCFYGYRCQYLHHEPMELKALTEKWARVETYFQQIDVVEEDQLEVFNNIFENAVDPQDLQSDGSTNVSMINELKKLVSKNSQDPKIPIIHLLNSAIRLRLPVFQQFTAEQAAQQQPAAVVAAK
jgi:hypothetical protein